MFTAMNHYSFKGDYVSSDNENCEVKILSLKSCRKAQTNSKHVSEQTAQMSLFLLQIIRPLL